MDRAGRNWKITVYCIVKNILRDTVIQINDPVKNIVCLILMVLMICASKSIYIHWFQYSFTAQSQAFCKNRFNTILMPIGTVEHKSISYKISKSFHDENDFIVTQNIYMISVKFKLWLRFRNCCLISEKDILPYILLHEILNLNSQFCCLMRQIG